MGTVSPAITTRASRMENGENVVMVRLTLFYIYLASDVALNITFHPFRPVPTPTFRQSVSFARS